MIHSKWLSQWSQALGNHPMNFLRIVVLTFVLHSDLIRAKKLVLFAGPHKAASGSVERFFHNHASEYEGTTIAEGLQGWLWPKVTKDLWVDHHTSIEKTEIFNALVMQADNTTAQIILKQAIQDAWDASEYGIMIGTPEFDRVGPTPYTHRKGLAAMRGILQQLQIYPEDVTVVLNYRRPRKDQWISMWKHAEGNVHYHRFLCKGDTDELLELLDTAMNPFKLAEAYRKESWKVVLVDMKGVDALKKDISHIIACDVLENTTCEDGFVVPVMQTYNENYGGDQTLTSLRDGEQDDLDQLFLERDCYYQPKLANDGGFKILYGDAVWKGCLGLPDSIQNVNDDDQNQNQNEDEDEEHVKSQLELYEHLSDPKLLLEALKQQKDCSSTEARMNDILVGNYDNMTKVENSGGAILVTESTSGKPNEGIIQLPEESGRIESPWITAMLVVVAFGLGMYQIQLIRRRNQGFNNGNSRNEQELSIVYRPNDLTLSTGRPERFIDGDII